MTPEAADRIYRSERWKRLRLQVLHRDGWRCAYCRAIIDRRLPSNHRLGATVDHIKPLLAGGLPYDPNNCRAMHRRCNTLRALRRHFAEVMPERRQYPARVTR